MRFIDFLSAKTVKPTEACIYGAPMGTFARLGSPALLEKWSKKIEDEIGRVLAYHHDGDVWIGMAEGMQVEPLQALTTRLFMRGSALSQRGARDRYQAAFRTWAFFELLRAFETSLQVKPGDRLLGWRGSFRLLAVSQFKGRFFTAAMNGYKMAMETALVEAAPTPQVPSDASELPPMARYLYGTHFWFEKSKDARLKMPGAPGFAKAKEWMRDLSPTPPDGEKHWGKQHNAVYKGAYAELALNKLNLTEIDMAALFGAIPAGEIPMKPLETYDYLADLAERQSDPCNLRDARVARFAARQPTKLAAQWCGGDRTIGEIAISNILESDVLESAFNLWAYLCLKQHGQPDRIVALDLSAEDWDEESATLTYEYDIADSGQSLPLCGETAHIDTGGITISDDEVSGSRVLRIEAHLL